MNIETYAAKTVHPLMIYPQQLEVSATLVITMFALRGTAETQGIEYGCNLFLSAGRIIAAGTIVGDQGGISLDAGGASKDPDYIGDVHVHPYRRKMSATASIGFSTDDVASYMRKRGGPGMQDLLHFHFVVAGPKVWLIVMYPWSDAKPQGEQEVANDVNEAMRFLGNDQGRYDKWRAGQHTINDASTLDDKIGAERRMWDQIPEYPAVFAKANKTMNKTLADCHKYGLYIGRLGDPSSMADLVLNRKV